MVLRDLPNPDEDIWWDEVMAPLTKAHPARPVHLLEKTYTITQGRLVQLIYAMYPPDLVIKLDLADDLMPQSFSRFEEAVMCGYEKACEVLEGKQVELLV